MRLGKGSLREYTKGRMMTIVSSFTAWQHAFFNFVVTILEEIVAIKAIDMKGVRDPAAKEMLEFEIEALNVLQHRNIMKCHAVIRETSHCYIIT
mgnify:CR=1 FL=1|jgi:hypothetical protein